MAGKFWDDFEKFQILPFNFCFLFFSLLKPVL